jgi:hypothetical protein
MTRSLSPTGRALGADEATGTERQSVSTHAVVDFTVSDLLQGGDDVVQLVSAADEPNGLWDEIGHWPRQRLTAALVAAIGVIQGDETDEVAAGPRPRSGRDRPGPDRPVTAATATAPRSDGH